MKEDLKDLQRIINSDKAVLEWFKSVNNERTVYNYRADFPNFLRYTRENTEFKTPSEIIEARRKDLQSNDTKTQRRFEEIGKEFMHSLEKKGLRYNTIKSSANLYRDSTVSLSNLCPRPFYEHTDLKRAWIGGLTSFLY